MSKQIHILGGGTFSHIRNHLSLATPSFGSTAKKLSTLFTEKVIEDNLDYSVYTHLTKMADSNSKLVTNDDVEKLVDSLLENPDTKIIVFNVALTDFTGQIGDIPSGKYAPRLESRLGEQVINIKMANKLVGKIRQKRKDIFLVAFKTTAGADEDTQYLKALNLLKSNSVNIVLANDTVNRRNMIVVPEEARYDITTDRDFILSQLVSMTLARASLRFTRSTVVEGDSINWNGDSIPSSLREVVNFCIEKGAYKPFRGSTAGHFAYKVDDKTFYTSKRKTNFNHLDDVGLVKVVSSNADEVIAYGAKPSVGGQSQRIVFAEHPDKDCIVHFHCPPKSNVVVPTREQRYLECGSHECGKNTSDGLQEVESGIEVVYLDNHGPNIVFNQSEDPKRVIAWIEKHFDLSSKTGGLVS